MRHAIYIAALLLAALPAAAQEDARISASLSPQEIPFHRTATYTLRIETTGEGAINFPELKSVEPDLNIRKGEPREERTETSAVFEQDYTIDAVRAGVYFLPERELSLDGGATLTIPALALSVRDLSEDEVAAAQQFDDIAMPELLEPDAGLPAWAYAAIAGFVLALAAGLLWLWRKRRQGPAAPPAPAWEVARRRLRELESRNLPRQGKYETYYVDLTDILRYYIDHRFAIHAPELTTPEFMETAKESGKFSEEQQEALFTLMRHCDTVKFAARKPASEEMQEIIDTVKRFVEETIPREEETEPIEEQAA